MIDNRGKPKRLWSYKFPQKDWWRHYFIFDTETENIEDPEKEITELEGRLVFAVIRYNGQNFRYIHTDIDKIKEKFQELADKGAVGICHNMEFDLSRIYGNLIANSSSYIHRNRFIKVVFPRKNTRHKHITFVDSFNLFPVSLADVGKMIGYPKLESEYNYKVGQEIKEEDWIYCETDCLIVDKALQLYKETFSKTFGRSPALTNASTAFSVIMDQFVKVFDPKKMERGKFEMFIDKDLHDVGNLSYKGGMTRAFETGEFKNMELYDISSSYPYSMTQPFPDPRYSWRTKDISNLDEILNDYEGFAEIHVKKCNIKNTYIPYKNDKERIGYKKDNLLYYLRDDEFKTWLTFPELRYLMNHRSDYDFEVLTLVYSKRIESPFKDIVETAYQIKQKAEKENNQGLRYTAKIFLNSSYGKLKMQIWDEEFISNIDDFIDIKRKAFNDRDKFIQWLDLFFSKYYKPINDICGYYIGDKADSDFVLSSFAAYITGRSRVRIWEYCQLGIYTDTDSLIVPSKDLIPPGLGLGSWQHEKTLLTVKIYGKKWYEYVDDKGKKIKLKGVKVYKQDIENYDMLKPKPFYRMRKAKEALRQDKPAGNFILTEKILSVRDDEYLPKV